MNRSLALIPAIVVTLATPHPTLCQSLDGDRPCRPQLALMTPEVFPPNLYPCASKYFASDGQLIIPVEVRSLRQRLARRPRDKKLKRALSEELVSLAWDQFDDDPCIGYGETLNHAITLLREAVRIDPGNATARCDLCEMIAMRLENDLPLSIPDLPDANVFDLRLTYSTPFIPLAPLPLEPGPKREERQRNCSCE